MLLLLLNLTSTRTYGVVMSFELEKLRVELRHIRGMYAMAQSETFDASRRLNDLQKQQLEEYIKLKELKVKEEESKALAEQQKKEHEAAKREAEYVKECVRREATVRLDAEENAMQESKEKQKLQKAITGTSQKYENFTWVEIVTACSSFSEDLKIGTGGNGTVYKSSFHHTVAAVKVVHSQEAHRTKQFQQELEVLSRIRHPHLLILIGACVDHGCLVYEYMENGSLDERLFRINNTPPIPWFVLSVKPLWISHKGFVSKVNEDNVLTSFTIVRVELLNALSPYLYLEMFSSETGRWVGYKLSCGKPIALLKRGGGPICFNGILHWFVYDHGMIAFDPLKEPKSCRLIQFPEDRDVENESKYDGLYRLCDECKGTLRFFEVAPEASSIYCFSMWDMKDYEKGEWCSEFKVTRWDLSSSDPELSSWLTKATFLPLSFDPFNLDIVYLRCVELSCVVSYSIENKRLDVACRPIGVVEDLWWRVVVPFVIPRLVGCSTVDYSVYSINLCCHKQHFLLVLKLLRWAIFVTCFNPFCFYLVADISVSICIRSTTDPKVIVLCRLRANNTVRHRICHTHP
nr:U-box domain-containing protein kinase family protein [Tanacetum cinerariifolium]